MWIGITMHHLLAVVWFFYFHYLLGSLIGAFFFLAAFALFGIETGLHRKYVATLLATFEVSRLFTLSLLISPTRISVSVLIAN